MRNAEIEGRLALLRKHLSTPGQHDRYCISSLVYIWLDCYYYSCLQLDRWVVQVKGFLFFLKEAICYVTGRASRVFFFSFLSGKLYVSLSKVW